MAFTLLGVGGGSGAGGGGGGSAPSLNFSDAANSMYFFLLFGW